MSRTRDGSTLAASASPRFVIGSIRPRTGPSETRRADRTRKPAKEHEQSACITLVRRIGSAARSARPAFRSRARCEIRRRSHRRRRSTAYDHERVRNRRTPRAEGRAFEGRVSGDTRPGPPSRAGAFSKIRAPSRHGDETDRREERPLAEHHPRRGGVARVQSVRDSLTAGASCRAIYRGASRPRGERSSSDGPAASIPRESVRAHVDGRAEDSSRPRDTLTRLVMDFHPMVSAY